MTTLKCDICGRFIADADEKARRELVYPDSAYTVETWETLCGRCAEKNEQES